MSDIEQAYRDGLTDRKFMTLDDVKDDLVRGKDQTLATLAANARPTWLSDANLPGFSSSKPAGRDFRQVLFGAPNE